MELFMESIKRVSYCSDANDIAYDRVNALLRAFGIQSSSIRSTEAQRILAAAVQTESTSSQPLETIVAETVYREIHKSLNTLSSLLSESSEGASHEKLLLALKLTNIPHKHPQVILGVDLPTEEELVILKQVYRRQNFPKVKRSSMGPSALRFESIDEMTTQTSALLTRFPALRWAIQISLLGLITFILYTFVR